MKLQKRVASVGADCPEATRRGCVARRESPAGHAWPAGFSLRATRGPQDFLCGPSVARRTFPAGHAWPAPEFLQATRGPHDFLCACVRVCVPGVCHCQFAPCSCVALAHQLSPCQAMKRQPARPWRARAITPVPPHAPHPGPGRLERPFPMCVDSAAERPRSRP